MVWEITDLARFEASSSQGGAGVILLCFTNCFELFLFTKSIVVAVTCIKPGFGGV